MSFGGVDVALAHSPGCGVWKDRLVEPTRGRSLATRGADFHTPAVESRSLHHQ